MSFWRAVLENATASGAIAAVVGGLAGFAGSLSMHLRQRKDASKDALEGLVDDLKVESLSYWRVSGQDSAREERLAGLCTRCIDRINRHNRRHLNSRNRESLERMCGDLMIDLTGGNFGTKNRKADLLRSKRIEDRIDELRSRLEIE